MSYIKGSLSKGEEVYQIFKLHWMIGFLTLINIILSIVSMGIWLIPTIFILLSWKNIEQGVTNKRVIRKHGIISIQTDEIRINAIESIFINQGIFGRIFGYGTVTITGRGQGDVKLKWMADPLRVKREIESIEYGEIREIPVEKDGNPINSYKNEIFVDDKNSNYWVIAGVSLISIIAIFSLAFIIGENTNNKSPSETVKSEVVKTEQHEQTAVAEEKPASIPEPVLQEVDKEQPPIKQETVPTEVVTPNLPNTYQVEQENTELSRYKAKDALDEANKQINVVWNGATKEIRKSLLPEQKDWLKERETDCTLKASAQDPNDTIVQDTIKMNCMVAMTNQRIEVLKQKIAALTNSKPSAKAPINQCVIELLAEFRASDFAQNQRLKTGNEVPITDDMIDDWGEKCANKSKGVAN